MKKSGPLRVLLPARRQDAALTGMTGMNGCQEALALRKESDGTGSVEDFRLSVRDRKWTFAGTMGDPLPGTVILNRARLPDCEISDGRWLTVRPD